jgi:hypothetical protein
MGEEQERAVPTPDVLPSRVPRRWSRRDALLPALLAAELLAGVLLGAGWQHHDLVVPALSATGPGTSTPAAGARAADPVPVVVLPPAAVLPAPSPLRTVPRNPFAVQAP